MKRKCGWLINRRTVCKENFLNLKPFGGGGGRKTNSARPRSCFYARICIIKWFLRIFKITAVSDKYFHKSVIGDCGREDLFNIEGNKCHFGVRNWGTANSFSTRKHSNISKKTSRHILIIFYCIILDSIKNCIFCHLSTSSDWK